MYTCVAHFRAQIQLMVALEVGAEIAGLNTGWVAQKDH